MRRFLHLFLAVVILILLTQLWEIRAARGPLVVVAFIAGLAAVLARLSGAHERIPPSGRDPADVGEITAAGRQHQAPGQLDP